MKIAVLNKQHSVSISFVSVRSVVRLVLSSLRVITDEILVSFVSDVRIRKLHDFFFNDSSTTDTISCPLDPYDSYGDEYHVLGEIFINPQAAISFCNKKRLTITKFDLYGELTLYLVHSLLHLCGYDDVNPQDRKKMRRKESQILYILRKNNILITSKT